MQSANKWKHNTVQYIQIYVTWVIIIWTFLFGLRLYVPVNNFQSRLDAFLSCTSTKQYRWSVLLKDTTQRPWLDSNPRPCDQDFSTLLTELAVPPNHMNNGYGENWGGRGTRFRLPGSCDFPFACIAVRSLHFSYNTKSLTNCINWKYGIVSVDLAVAGIDRTLKKFIKS